MDEHRQIRLIVDATVRAQLEHRRLTDQDLQKTIFTAEQSGRKFIDPESGRFLAGVRPYFVTVWVEYRPVAGGYQIYRAYSHRVKIDAQETASSTDSAPPEKTSWRCLSCNQRLVAGPVRVDYLGNHITAELPQCPTCKRVWVSEELALGKVAEVEKLLEDK